MPRVHRRCRSIRRPDARGPGPRAAARRRAGPDLRRHPPVRPLPVGLSLVVGADLQPGRPERLGAARARPPAWGPSRGSATRATPVITTPSSASGRFDGFRQGAVDPYAPWNNDAYRSLDAQYGRVYQPNAAADDLYHQGQQQRDELYRRATTEPDPQLRARYLREYRARAAGSASGSRPRPRTGSSAARAPTRTQTNGQPSRVGNAVPRVVRSYDDLLRCAQVIDRAALRRAIAAEAAGRRSGPLRATLLTAARPALQSGTSRAQSRRSSAHPRADFFRSRIVKLFTKSPSRRLPPAVEDASWATSSSRSSS